MVSLRGETELLLLKEVIRQRWLLGTFGGFLWIFLNRSDETDMRAQGRLTGILRKVRGRLMED